MVLIPRPASALSVTIFYFILSQNKRPVNNELPDLFLSQDLGRARWARQLIFPILSNISNTKSVLGYWPGHRNKKSAPRLAIGFLYNKVIVCYIYAWTYNNSSNNRTNKSPVSQGD